ncbi:MAG: acyltransferase family protein [Acidimicrobiales bacterium]
MDPAPTDLGTPDAPAPPTPRSASERRPALDGLRAFAVVAVILYHVDPHLVPGGFVGVDLFFVLSGYLITTLLLTEHRTAGRVSLRQFWARRIRRLWPLAWVVLTAVALASLAGVWGADRQRSVPAELASAFGHIANWYQIGHGGYVHEFAAPSPVRHYWSLAIEEQFYLVWPLLLTGLLAVRRVRNAVPTALAALAAASIALGWVVAGSPDRAYLGTDVRAVALVTGASLAWAFRHRPLSGPANRNGRRVAAIVGMVGAVVLVGATVWLHSDSSLLPRGGFAIVAMASGGVVVGALTSGPAIAALSWRPIGWIGRISFALYLVHWPMLVALGPGRSTLLRLAVALPGAIAVAALLHRFVERPVITRRPPWQWLTAATVGLASIATVALVASVPEGRTATERVAESLGTVADPTTSTTQQAAAAADTTTTSCVPPSTTTAAPTTTTPGRQGGFDPSTVGEIADPTGRGCGGALTLLVLGDSTGRGAANGLAKLGDPRLVVWDRTTLGCSFGDEHCPDWRQQWGMSVAGIDPDVVLVYDSVVDDFHGVDDKPFMSPEESAIRIQQLEDATKLLSSAGAKVYFVTPAVPRRPNGLYFCEGDGTDTRCDPDWVARWNDDVRAAAQASGAKVIDVGGWIMARGATAADRPDGLHLAGAALAAHAAWLAPQLEAGS